MPPPACEWLSVICASDVLKRQPGCKKEKACSTSPLKHLRPGSDHMSAPASMDLEAELEQSTSGNDHEPAAASTDLEAVLQSMVGRTKMMVRLATEQERELETFRARVTTAEATASANSSCCQSGQPADRTRSATAVTFEMSDGPLPLPDNRPAWMPTENAKRAFSKMNVSGLTGCLERMSGLECGAPESQRSHGRLPAFGTMVFGTGSRFVLSPAGSKKMGWDLASAVVIAYDILVLPLMFFGYDEDQGAIVASMFTTMFWTIDMALQCLSGFHTEDGVIEMHVGCTARHYLRTWFPLDATVLLVDWLLCILGIDASEAVNAGRLNRVGRFMRIMKVLRFARLLRVKKLAHILELVGQQLVTPSLWTFLNIVRLLLGLAVFVHYITCCWYAIGNATHQEYDSWIDPWMERGLGKGYLYVIAYHWTMAQFLPAPTPDHPRNLYERLFTIFVLFTGFALFSSTLGSVTAIISHTKNQAYRKMLENHALRRFFVQDEISHVLASRVLHFQAAAAGRRQPVSVASKDLKCLHNLPPSLKSDMMYEVHISSLSVYPLFEVVNESSQKNSAEVCVLAVSEIVASKDDTLFQFHGEATSLRFVRSGKVLYYSKADQEVVGGETVISEASKYLSEAALWLLWQHQGLAKASEVSRIVTLDASAFSQVACVHPEMLGICCEYARLFRMRLTDVVNWEDVLDDVFRAFESEEELLQAAKELS